MGLDAVVAEIREKGRTESDAIVKAGETKKVEVLTEANQKIESIKNSAKEDMEKNISHIISQEVTAGHLIVKRQVLNTQKELLDKVYLEALEGIKLMPDTFHKEAITSLLRKAKDEIPSGKVICASRDEVILKQILKEKEFSSFGFSLVIPIDGGIIVETADGKLQVDYSYRTFLNQVYESGLKDVSDLLFR